MGNLVGIDVKVEVANFSYYNAIALFFFTNVDMTKLTSTMKQE